ncbi:MAG: CRISPR-associated protein Cas4 [Heliobacteriaceae bacterium]|nr:CRISPR-associated protein Cas4 [Heliobacteriaceae bacterium]
MEAVIVPISALNAFTYCPYRCYLEYVCGEFIDNEHTLQGSFQHERVDTPGDFLKEGVRSHRAVALLHEELGIIGRTDLVEETNGLIYPVEYKKGRKGKWNNDEVQLCAQALALEQRLGINIAFGYLFYFSSRVRVKVVFTEELRVLTRWTIGQVRELLQNARRPAKKYTPRCNGCSLNALCLPREEAMLIRAAGEVDKET